MPRVTGSGSGSAPTPRVVATSLIVTTIRMV